MGLGLALVILAAVASLAYRSIDGARVTLDWVEHTYRVLQQVEEVSAAHSRAASTRLVFVVAGDGSQLADRPELDARVTRAIAGVRTSMADNPVQIQRLDTLAQLLDQRIAALDASVERRRLGEAEVEPAEDPVLLARIGTVRKEMDSKENRLLADRDARTRRDLTITKLAEVAGTLASFAILLFAFMRLRQAIARRQRSERALRASEGFLSSIVENIPDMIFVKGADGLRFEWINRAGETLLGIERKDLVGKNDFDLYPRGQADSHQARDHETLVSRVVIDIPEEPIQTKEGERWLHTKKVPIFDEHGKPSYLLGISEDITERRLAAGALKTAKDAAEASNQELETFSYSVAHDLRAPLRGMNGFAKVLLDDYADRLDADGRDCLQEIHSNAKMMGDLIDSLLSLSRVTRGEIRRQPVDLAALARTAMSELADVDPERRVEFVIQEHIRGDIDPQLARAVVDNLLGNAWKFTKNMPKARIEFGTTGTTANGDSSAFFVRDNGAGFDMAYANKLFAPFHRLHTVAEFPGTGIGLATVQRIVRRHGGRIWAEASVNAGATFYFTLPTASQGAST